MLHALGIPHRQNLPDRTDNVYIVNNNIAEDRSHNYFKYSDSQISSFNLPYDYGSMLHSDASENNITCAFVNLNTYFSGIRIR